MSSGMVFFISMAMFDEVVVRAYFCGQEEGDARYNQLKLGV